MSERQKVTSGQPSHRSQSKNSARSSFRTQEIQLQQFPSQGNNLVQSNDYLDQNTEAQRQLLLSYNLDLNNLNSIKQAQQNQLQSIIDSQRLPRSGQALASVRLPPISTRLEVSVPQDQQPKPVLEELVSSQSQNENGVHPDVRISFNNLPTLTSKLNICDEAINNELDEIRRKKHNEKSAAFLKDTILKYGDDRVIKYLMRTREGQQESQFEETLAFIMFIVHTYNFFTIFFFMGIEGFPTGFWYTIECITELLMILNVTKELMLMFFCKKLWQSMGMLHDQEKSSKTNIICLLLAAIPSSMILSITFRDRRDILLKFGIACVRLPKLLRFWEVRQYYVSYDEKSRQQGKFSLLSPLFIVYYLQTFMHFWTCFWLATGRLDWSRNEAGWNKMANFDKGPSTLEMYIESYFFVITTFAGAGFGNIVPSTNAEWFVDTGLNLIGSSLFICIFVDFVMEYSMRSLTVYENNNLLQQTMQFAESTSLPKNLVFKIRYYFKDLNIQFQDFLLKQEIVNGVPNSMKGQISFMMNRELIENLQIYKNAPKQFFEQICVLLSPQICMNDDYIVKMGDEADKLYFIHSGYVEVLCKNGINTLIYLSKGAHFGEVGIFITDKRSVSVRAQTNCILYSILKDDLIGLLAKYPEQMQELTQIAQSRYENSPNTILFRLNHKDSNNVSEYMNEMKSKEKDFEQVNLIFKSKNTTTMSKKPWIRQTYDAVMNHLIMPLGRRWWLWNLILIAAIFINMFLIPFQIGFEQDYTTHPLMISCFIVYFIDIPIRMKTGITADYRITTDTHIIVKDYLNRWLILDIISTFPYEYFLNSLGIQDGAKYVMLLRLLKIGRLVETAQIFIKNTRSRFAMACFFLSLFMLQGFLMHWQACGLGWIGRRELNRNSRYDGKTYFKDFETRPYVTLGPLIDLPPWDQYIVCLYLSGQVMQAVSYGDAVVYAMSEQLWVIMFFIATQTQRAFLIVKMAKYLGVLQNNTIEKVQKTKRIENWMSTQNLPEQFKKRIRDSMKEQRHTTDLFEGSEILVNLPVTLQSEIKEHLKSSQIPRVQQPTVMARHLKTFFKIHIEKTVQQHNLDIIVKPDLTKQYKVMILVKRIREKIELICILWNMWFIPLQFAYNIEFKHVFFIFEIFTILVYFSTIFFKFYQIKWVNKYDCVEHEVLRRKDIKIVNSSLWQKKEIQGNYFRIFTSVVAIIPFSLIIQQGNHQNSWNMALVVFLSSIRLLQLEPFQKFQRQKQKDNFVSWRIISLVYTYYFVCHWFACIMIKMAISDADWTQNWLRRCPVPQMSGTRTLPDSRVDLTNLSIYVHALYYVVGTVSHVAIGDITAVNTKEFLSNAIFGWIATFFYCYLFADITLLVQKATSQNYKKFMINRSYIMNKIQSSQIPQALLNQINFYLSYTFEVYEGVTQEEILQDLPENLKVDFLITKYREIANNCLLFRQECSPTLPNLQIASELLKCLQIQIFLDQSIIVKVGYSMHHSIFLLEGQIQMKTLRRHSENCMLLQPGDFYGTDIDAQIDSKTYAELKELELVPQVVLNPKDNFENRCLVHLVARNMVTLGVLAQDQLKQLYERFPSLKNAMQKQNRFSFEFARKSVELCLRDSNQNISRETCLALIDGHYDKSTSEDYWRITQPEPYKRQNQLVRQSMQGFVKQNSQIKDDQKKDQNKLIFKTERTKGVLCCLQNLVVDNQNTLLRRFLTILVFIDRLYIAFACPIYIAFDVKLSTGVLIVEIISHIISFVHFLLQFRTPVLKENGELTLQFKYVLRSYLRRGMIYTIFAFLPFNLILPWIKTEQRLIKTLVLSPVRALRMISVYNLNIMFQQIRGYFRRGQDALKAIQNIAFIFLLGHWAVCAWMFLINVAEDQFAMNFIIYFNLQEKKMWEVYLRDWYAVANIVSSVGSGDIFGTTDLERLFFTFLMTAADIVFALAFGLLAELTTNARQNDKEQNFLNKIIQAERIMNQSKFNENVKDCVEQYLTYEHQLQSSSNYLNQQELKRLLPECLVKEIFFHSNRAVLIKLFQNLESENMIRDLAYTIRTQILIPGDVIIARGHVVKEIYYIVEGKAKVVSKRGENVKVLGEGSFCGEFALFQDVKPKQTIVAETFMLMKVLSKTEIDFVISQYPQIEKRHRAVDQSQILRFQQSLLIKKENAGVQREEEDKNSSEESESESLDSSKIFILQK